MPRGAAKNFFKKIKINKTIITKLIKFQKIQFELNIVPLLLPSTYIKVFLQGDQGDFQTPN